MLTIQDKEYLTQLLENINGSLQSDIYEIRNNSYISELYKRERIVDKEQNINSRVELIERLNHVNGKLIAPFKDYVGNVIVVGDTIKHPSGQKGIVEYYDNSSYPNDNWMVNYGSAVRARLCLQLGEIGKGVVYNE